MAAIKGQGADARDALGNISAPWLALSFVAGAGYARIRLGALVGLVAALIALAVFYMGESFVLDLGRHSWIVDLQLSVRAGRVYFVQALLSGPIFGALGALWAKTRARVFAVAVALLFVFEPVVVWLYERRSGGGGGDGSLTHYPLLWMGEVILGLVVTGALVVRGSRTS